MQKRSRILIVVLVMAFSVSFDSARGEENRVLRVVETATVFDVKSMKPLSKLGIGDEVEVLKSIYDADREQWLEIISVQDKKVRGYLRAKKCAPLKEADVASGRDEEEQGEIMLPGNPAAVMDLGLRILRAASKEQTNPIVSPYGIWSNSRFWLSAAKGETLEQLEKQLELQREKGAGPVIRAQSSFRSVDRLLRSPNIDIKRPWLDTASQWHLSVVDSAFDEPARVELNSWIRKWSMDRIPEFYAKDEWDPNAELIFVNVASLDAEWANKFEKSSTQAATFHKSIEETTTVDMMIQQSNMRWFASADHDVTGVVLPYQDNDLAAVLFVPNAIDGIAGLTEQINSDAVDGMLTTGRDEDVVLILPRFEVDASLNLFEQLDLQDVLSANPDFSEMTDNKTTISDFRQRIHLSVDEDGTRAAAVTSTTIVPSATGDKKPKIVQADRPFLFLVMHMPTRTLLFATRINEPTVSSAIAEGR